VERVIAPDATIALDFMLRRMTYVLGNLCVYPENMRRNLEKSGGMVFSEKILLALVGKGLARDVAYRMVQRQALKVGREGGDLKRELLADQEIRRYLSAKEIEAVWGVKHHLTHVDFIFRRAFQ
jgi:adenylosuccinate lyase